DQYNVTGKQRGIEFPGQDVVSRDETVASRRREVKPNPAGSVRRYHELSDADCRQPGFFAEALLGVRSSSAAHVAGYAQCYSKRLGGERGIRLSPEPQNQRNPANHMVPIDRLVEKPISGGCRF